MRPPGIPIVSKVVDAGADDQLFDALLLLGPLIIGLVAVAERSIVTELVAVVYVGTFLTYVLYRGLA